MTSENDAEFLVRMEYITLWREVDDKSERDRLFALARRGAGLTLDRQKLVAYPDGSEWIEELYSRFVPYQKEPSDE